MSWPKVTGGMLLAVATLILLDKGGHLRSPQIVPARPAPAAATSVAAAKPGFQPSDETPDMLPDAPGRDETFYLCTGCHGTALIRAQGMGRGQWDESLNWMTEKHNMPRPDDATRALVLDYLTATFPARQEEKRGWTNPFSNRQ